MLHTSAVFGKGSSVLDNASLRYREVCLVALPKHCMMVIIVLLQRVRVIENMLKLHILVLDTGMSESV